MGSFFLIFITFLSAFLLFEIEFIIAKMFLPGYGGSYVVWGACIVFFQAILLLGYWFSHHFIGRLGWVRYRFVHLALLAMPLIFFPGKNLNPVFVNSSLPLVLDVFLRLAVTIGPVFFVLSTMSIATQMWMTKSKLAGRMNPYSLYAVSNLGSFLALLNYPFLIEFFLDVGQQVGIWRAMYFLLILINLVTFFIVPAQSHTEQKKTVLPVERSKVIRWILFGAGGSMIFLSVNNIMTYELPPVPLFWIFPLSIYLLSFVLNFKKEPWCPAWIRIKIAPIIGFSAVYFLFVQKYNLPALLEFTVLLGVLFCLCMFCQHELIRSKPQQDENLTSFYFFISLGSFIGGIVTTWIVPLVSVSMIEYFCALIVIALAHFYGEKTPLLSTGAVRIIIYLKLFYYLWSAFFINYNVFAIVVLFFLTWKTYRHLGEFRYGVLTALIVLVFSIPAQEKMWDRKATDNTWKMRNYYGIHEVVDSDQVRWLYHGRTLHGGQFFSAANRSKPLTYYGPHSGVWDLMNWGEFHVSNAALIGLGTGTMTTFLEKGQSLDIFELDPDVYKIAMDKFYFLRDSKVSKRVFMGDARLSLKEVHDRSYDMILIDAFGGDAIPVHLLTTQVFNEYKSHLNTNGVILVHVSNRYLDLVPVLARVARSVGANISYKLATNSEKFYTSSCWMFITWNNEIFKKFSTHKQWTAIRLQDYPGRAWTDNYSSVLPAMKLEYLMNNFKNFNFFSW